jgi:hypothetical protein
VRLVTADDAIVEEGFARTCLRKLPYNKLLSVKDCMEGRSTLLAKYVNCIIYQIPDFRLVWVAVYKTASG